MTDEITNARLVELTAKARWMPSDISDVELALRELIQFRMEKSCVLANSVNVPRREVPLTEERLNELIANQWRIRPAPADVVDVESALRELRTKRAIESVLVTALDYIKEVQRQITSDSRGQKILTWAAALGVHPSLP